MGRIGIRIAIGCVIVLLVIGSRLYYRNSDSQDVREAAYQRYSQLASPEEVKAAVDRHHDDAFSDAYRLGGKRQSNKFDQTKYLAKMDTAVPRDLAALHTPPPAPEPTAEELAELARQEDEARQKALHEQQQRESEAQRLALEQEQQELQAQAREQEAQEAQKRALEQRQFVESSNQPLDPQQNPAQGVTTAAPPAPQPEPEAAAPPVVWDAQVAANALAGDNETLKTEAMRWLAKSNGDGLDSAARKAVVGPLLTLLDQGTPDKRTDVIAALGAVGDASVVKPLLPLLEENAPENDRRAAMAALGKIGDARAAFPIARWIQLDTENCEKALIAMGPVAETEVTRLLRFRTNSVDVSVCRVLGAIGTGRSIRILTSKSHDADPAVRSAAESALKAVIERNRASN